MRAGLDGPRRASPIARGRHAAAWRRASRRSGTPAWPCWRWPTPAWRPTTRRSCGPPTGCSTRRSASPATGRCAGPRSRRAAGPSSSPTTTTPTSTTPPRWCWRCAGVAHPDRARRRGGHRPRASRGSLGMQSATAAGRAFDADNTARAVPASCRSATSARSSTRRRADVTAHVVEMLAARGPRRRRRAGPARRRLAAGRSRRPTARGSGAGAPTTSTAPAPPCPPWSPPASAPTTRRMRRAVALARAPPERRRRLGRGPALLRRPERGRDGARRRASQTAWALLALLAAGEPRRTAVAARRRAGWSAPSAPTAPGTSRSSPAPGSPATSTSTTTCTGRCSR